MDSLKVCIGKNGWLFLDNDTNRIMEQISNKIPFDKYFLYRYKLNYQMRHAYLKSQNIDYYVFIVPNKECVYSQYLPENIVLSEERIIRKCQKEMHDNNLNFFHYLIEDLYIQNNSMDTYRKGDTHWNQYGAFIFYKKMIDLIDKRKKLFSLSYNDINFEKVPLEGDLSSKIANNFMDEDIIGTINKINAKLIYNNNVHNTGSLKIYENILHSDYPVVVVFRDSFTNWMEAYIAESFSKTIFVHQANLDYLLIEKYKPDIVLSIQVERFNSGIPCDVLGPMQSQNESKKRK